MDKSTLVEHLVRYSRYFEVLIIKVSIASVSNDYDTIDIHQTRWGNKFLIFEVRTKNESLLTNKGRSKYLKA